MPLLIYKAINIEPSKNKDNFFCIFEAILSIKVNDNVIENKARIRGKQHIHIFKIKY